MVLCHGPGGIPGQINGEPRGIASGVLTGGRLGFKNFITTYLSTLSKRSYCCRAIMRMLTTTIAAELYMQFTPANQIFVA
jgi:hypothetical protein